MELTATRFQADADGGTRASGEVEVRQGRRLLATGEFDFDRGSGIGSSPGPLRLREPGLEARGLRARIGTRDARMQLDDVEFVLLQPQLRGTAASTERVAAELRFASPTLTRCAPGSDLWRLDADRIRIDRDADAATVRGARLRLGGVPVFYSPYLRLPLGNRRAGGWLFPGLGSRDGFDLRLPYYLNLAENYDATVAGRWIRDRGTGVESEFRHLGRSSESALRGAFLAKDRDYDGTLSRAAFRALRESEPSGVSAFAPANRWLLAARHRGDYGRIETAVDFTGVSDNDYFVDLGTDLAATGRLLLERRVQVRYADGGLLARLGAQDYQRLEPGAAPYRRLPEASLGYGGMLPGPLSWHIGGSWTAFEPSGGPGSAGSRLHIEPQIRLPLTRSWGALGLAAKFRHTVYALQDPAPATERQPTRSVAAATVDGRLFLERPGPGGGLQVLEPRAQYRYQSYAEQDALPRFDVGRLTPSYQQLFRDNRFAGLDRIADANELAVGVAARLFDGNGRERLSAAVGAVARFAAHRVAAIDAAEAREGSSNSPVAGELAARMGRWRLAGAVAWDAETRRTDNAGFDLAYRAGTKRLINVGYRRRGGYRRPPYAQPIEHTDVSFHWPLARQWQAFARWNRDWRGGRTIETLAGVGYANCCLEAKLLWHDTVAAPRNRLLASTARDRGLLVQFVFRGLAGFGGNVDGRLERSIRGYRRNP